MTPSSRKYKIEFSYELLRIAEGDYESAKALASTKKGRPENVLYTAQQCLEKCLKSILIFKDKTVVHTHDLDVLVAILSEIKISTPEAHRLGAFSQYASVRRYEEGYEKITDEDLKLALDLTKKILDWAKGIVK